MMNLSSHTPSPISFRDPTGHVVMHRDHVERSCSPDGTAHVRTLLNSVFFKTAEAERLVCQSRFVESSNTVWQELIHPWSYPYEWSFSMLKEGAILTLELQQRALSAGYSLKDASAFNLTFLDGKPIFADVYSFEHFSPSLSWVAYDQFCREFFNPLLLHSITGIPLSTLLRGRLAGITSDEVARMLSWRALFRTGTLLHLYIKRKLDAKYARPGMDAPLMGPNKAPNIELCLEVQRKLVKGLHNTITRLRPKYSSAWETYTSCNSYQTGEHDLKSAAVKEFADKFPGESIIDYGCNTGHFSNILCSRFRRVISIDSDEASIDRLYRSHRDTPEPKLLPLVIDINNPSPAQGWGMKERQSFFERTPAEAFLALALVHHLRFGNNVPVSLIVELFAKHDRGIIEYVAFEDPMVQHLIRYRSRLDYSDYEREPFEQSLLKHFNVLSRVQISPTRELFVLKHH